MSERVFLDTNVILRLLLGDVPNQQLAAGRFVAQVESGTTIAVISDTVVFEVVYILEKQKRVPRPDIRRDLKALISEPAVELLNKPIYVDVFQRYVDRPGLSIADCFHIELARKLTGGRLATFDEKAGKTEGIDWYLPT